MGVAKDNYPRDGTTYSFVVGFAEVEVDVETGKVTLIDYLGVGDVGTVVNPRSLLAQINGGSCLGHRARAVPEPGLRPAVRAVARAALPLQQAADDPRHPVAAPVGRRSTFPIRRRRSAPAASASRRSAPATAPS